MRFKTICWTFAVMECVFEWRRMIINSL